MLPAPKWGPPGIGPGESGRGQIVRRVILAVAALALVATACGSELEPGNYADEKKGPSASPAPTLPPCKDTKGVTVSKDTATNLKVKPRLVITAKGCSFTKLEKIDLVTGTGEVVKAGAKVKAKYLGVGFTTRKEFDSSWKRGPDPIEFELAGVIKGWTDGVPGMKVGGRRLLIIPGPLAYGEAPGSPDILPNETLIFVIDMVSISK